MTRDADVFADALELPASERAEFLDRGCAGDAMLRARVEALLALHDEASDFLDVPLKPRGAILGEEKPGDQIGRYKVLQQIGEGGCGTVYMAEQMEPVRRRVALKVIKPGMDTKAVVARFGAEQQALALMDHPNIAKVFDGGATETGRPYFVMELVQGVPITKYCDAHSLPIRARLELFTPVCRAIGHAHHHGIIHRDIKPSNILVSRHDKVPAPKVIDFGIAKATQGRLTDATFLTSVEQLIGTPAYMSPEQAGLSPIEIDPRSDIYSLGVLLYELLTGRTPFDVEKLVHSGFDEMRRRIREVEPPCPSARLRTLERITLSTIARRRDTAAPELIKLVHGDLDWIVMRCLEKDRTRRYGSADELAADIVRHLGNDPVIARPPSPGYRISKAIRRNTRAFLPAALVLSGGAVWLVERYSKSPSPDPQRVITSSPAAHERHQRSIAVLPFTNLSEERDANAFFSEGMHDDITTNLARISELRVVSRTTAVQYRETTKTIREIGEELQVAYILEGSVRRAGDTVRVSAKLINARTDEHVWAQSYHRDLNDVFAIHAAMPQEIAAALHAAISPQEKSLIDRRPTDIIAAYDLLLKARQFRRNFWGHLHASQAIAMLESALALDPTLLAGWVELAYLEGLCYQTRFGWGLSPDVQAGHLARAKKAIQSAVALAPDSPEVMRGLGEYYYRCHLDYRQALYHLEKLMKSQPNDVGGLALIGAIQRRQGQWPAAVGTFRTVVRLDPGNYTNARDLVSLLAEGRRFGEAHQEQRRIAERQVGDDFFAPYDLAFLPFLATGATRQMEDFFQQMPAEQFNSEPILALRWSWAVRRGDLTEAVRLDQLTPRTHPQEELAMGVIAATRGELGVARARLERLRARLQPQVEQDPNDHRAWGLLGEIHAVLGQKDAAFQCVKRAIDLKAISQDAYEGGRLRGKLAFAKAWTGDKTGAVSDYAELLRMPYSSRNGVPRLSFAASVHVMRHDPHYSPLRGDPRFEALLNDPKNNAPLF